MAAIDVIGRSQPEGESSFLEYAEKLRVKVPVILTGGNRNVGRLERFSRRPDGFIAMARPLIREPDLPARREAHKGGPDVDLHFLKPRSIRFRHALPVND